MDIVERSCPLCKSDRNVKLDIYSRGDWVICRCEDCGFVFLRNAPRYDALINDLAWEKTFADESERRDREVTLRKIDKATRFRLKLFRSGSSNQLRRIFGQGRVLDIGCGGGTRLPEPIIPFGIEVSHALWQKADEIMRSRGGYAIHAPAVEGIAEFDDGYFKGVFARSFLEHEMDPARLLKEAYRVLEPGGVMYVRVPNFGSVNRRVVGPQWCGFRYPDHVNYFTLDTLRKMTAEAGFSLKLMNRIGFYFDDNIKACLVRPV